MYPLQVCTIVKTHIISVEHFPAVLCSRVPPVLYRAGHITRCPAPRSLSSSRPWPGASPAGCRPSPRTSSRRTPASWTSRSVECFDIVVVSTANLEQCVTILLIGSLSYNNSQESLKLVMPKQFELGSLL